MIRHGEDEAEMMGEWTSSGWSAPWLAWVMGRLGWESYQEWLQTVAEDILAIYATYRGTVVRLMRDEWGDVRIRKAVQMTSEERRAPGCAGRLQRFFLVHQLMM